MTPILGNDTKRQTTHNLKQITERQPITLDR